jgi:hypothetical protein
MRAFNYTSPFLLPICGFLQRERQYSGLETSPRRFVSILRSGRPIDILSGCRRDTTRHIGLRSDLWAAAAAAIS